RATDRHAHPRPHALRAALRAGPAGPLHGPGDDDPRRADQHASLHRDTLQRGRRTHALAHPNDTSGDAHIQPDSGRVRADVETRRAWKADCPLQRRSLATTDGALTKMRAPSPSV